MQVTINVKHLKII